MQLRDAFELAGVDLCVGGRLVDVFAAAGLAEPELMSETPVGGPGSQVPELAVEVWKTMLPVLAEAGRRPVRDPGFLLDEVRSAATAKRAQLFLPRNVAGWVGVAP